MLQQFIFIFCFLLQVSCGSTQVDVQELTSHVDTSLLPHVVSFTERYCQHKNCSRVDTIQFGDVQKHANDIRVVGICLVLYKVDGKRVANVIIDAIYWGTIGELQRSILLWHELGHCYLKMEYHNPDGLMGVYLLKLKSCTRKRIRLL